MTAVYAFAAADITALLLLATAARWTRCRQRARAAADSYRVRLKEQLARRDEDAVYAKWLLVADPVPDAVPLADPVDCECGAHVKGTPCYLPELRRDDWSRKVAPSLTVAKDGAA